MGEGDVITYKPGGQERKNARASWACQAAQLDRDLEKWTNRPSPAQRSVVDAKTPFSERRRLSCTVLRCRRAAELTAEVPSALSRTKEAAPRIRAGADMCFSDR